MRSVDFNTSWIFAENYNATESIVINQGGARSSKTYSILQMLIVKCMENRDLTITIVRKTLKALRSTAMRDFFDILKSHDLYVQDDHNRTDNIYQLNGNRIEFMGMDDPQKRRGASRDILFANEVNELTKEDWMQLEIRTRGQIFADFNPSDEFHWLYTEVIPRSKFIKSTYRDNPFLDAKVVERIERLKDTDPEAWRVYGLGEKAMSMDLIFPNFTISEIPESAKFLARGCDFGFTNDPTSIIDVYRDGDDLYFHERMYKWEMTNADIRKEMQLLEMDVRLPMYCDSADPKSIEELYRLGVNAKPSDKGKGSIIAGIQYLKSFHLHVTSDSHNMIKELRNYKWQKDKEEKRINVPVDNFNHCIDAMRYAVFTSLHSKGSGKYFIR